MNDAFSVPTFNDSSSFDSTEDDNTPDVDDVEVEDVETTPETSSSRSTGASAQRGMTRAQIRRIANKAQEVSEAPERIAEIAASLVGSGTGLGELTTAIMAADRSASTAIADLNAIADADPFDAAVDALALGKARLKSLWALLAALDAVKGSMPAAEVKAAKEAAKAVFSLDEIAKAELDTVVALLKKN